MAQGMTGKRIFLYDTTLRDGAQTQGVTFTVGDKLKVARMLDSLGVDYVEGGWPGANPTDDQFFGEKRPRLSRSKLCAFGMTRRAGRSAANDPGLRALFDVRPDVVTLVGKSSARQAEGALGVTRSENLDMIRESIAEAKRHVPEVMFDAEHFFDAFKADPDYALACLEAALGGGADWLVLCDTNGGTLPFEIEEIVGRVRERFPEARLGIHAHNDTGNAIANSLAAVRAGCTQIQGTLNGLGERCGNADLVALIPTLVFKMGLDVGIPPENIRHLTHLSRTFDELLNRVPNRHAPYVGASAFAHKGGLHASAVLKDPSFYEHIDPDLVGNSRDILVSDQAGRSNLLRRFEEMGIHLDIDEYQTRRILDLVKTREAQGFSYDGASASFELLVRRELGQVPDYFDVVRFRVINERRYNARGELVHVSEATLKVRIGTREFHEVADGDGPVNAIDRALRKALVEVYPVLADMRLVDYKVRILTPERGTAAVIRVMIESEDSQGRLWQTVGVSENIIVASYNALHDAITWKLLAEGAQAPDGR
ncbi:(R)-citramalate synthase [bacterium HR39]|nr:(R)-citramalate synthase [bacterium HR39]